MIFQNIIQVYNQNDEIKSKEYRPEIDGLRAIAIIAVVSFHASHNLMPGGYLGVDIFFAISGFLITKIIISNLEHGRFSFIEFYKRRILRIFPALSLVILCSLIAAWFMLLPTEMKAFGKSVLTAAYSVSNKQFRREAGYFELDANLKPLLNTWSLAVEEQFYIFFPLLLFIVFKFARKYLTYIIALIWIASLLQSFLLANNGKNIDAFFNLLPRGWELATGAWVATRPRLNPGSTAKVNVVAGVAIACIAAPLFLVHATFPYSCLWALPVVLGTGILLSLDPSCQPVSSRVLSAKPLVFIGLISYSLYLWHWPIFVFARYYLILPPSFLQMMALVFVSLAISVMSWRYVEQPFRGIANNADFDRYNIHVFSIFVFINVLFLFAGLAISKNNGLPNRFSRNIIAYTIVGKGTASHKQTAFGTNAVLGALNDNQPAILLWGDSHANSISPALSREAEKFHRSLVMMKGAGCFPSIENNTPVSDGCKKFNLSVHDYLRKHPELKTVVLAARWSVYPRWWDSENRDAGTEATRKIVADDLAKTVQKLKSEGRRVFIMLEVPDIGLYVPSALARVAMYKNGVDIRPKTADYIEWQKYDLALSQSLHDNFGAEIIYPKDALCLGERCQVERDGQSLYYDANHLSTYGAETMADLFAPVFAKEDSLQSFERPKER